MCYVNFCREQEFVMNKKILFNLALIAIAGSFGGLLAGYEMGIISGVQLFVVKEWNLSAELTGILVSIVMVGCFAGALINGALADKIGRKKNHWLNWFILPHRLLVLLTRSKYSNFDCRKSHQRCRLWSCERYRSDVSFGNFSEKRTWLVRFIIPIIFHHRYFGIVFNRFYFHFYGKLACNVYGWCRSCCDFARVVFFPVRIPKMVASQG